MKRAAFGLPDAVVTRVRADLLRTTRFAHVKRRVPSFVNMRRAAIALATGIAVAALVIGAAGEVLSRPERRSVGEAPPDLHALSVTVATSQTQSISGWLARGTPGLGAVLLLHGVRADRRQMLERARFLKRAGYSVMLIDLQAHGESTGARITFGLRESEGVKAALDYIKRELPSEKVAVLGVSLGAASLVLAKADPAPSAVVLESMYPTIAEAVTDRLVLHLGPLGRGLAAVLLWQIPLRLGASSEQLRPIVEIPSLHAPVLIASGAADQHTTRPETERLFQAASEPKQLWIVEGAAHVDLHAYDPKTYESRVLAFLHRYVRSGV